MDGIFVGQGAGMEALGAVNLALPFVLIVQALNAMASIGGVTITAVRFGSGDKSGAQDAFMHSVTINFAVGCLVTVIGCGLTGSVCYLLGGSGDYYAMVKDYVFWWALFAVVNSVSLNLQSFCRNDGNPGLVAVTNMVITTLNIFLDWLFVFPMQRGVAGAAIGTGISQVVGLLVISTHFVLKKEICGFGNIVGSVNTIISAYFYSTKRSGQAIVLNVVRSLIMNSLVILSLPQFFGKAVVWHTFGVYEVLVLFVAVAMKKISERHGIAYSTDRFSVS